MANTNMNDMNKIILGLCGTLCAGSVFQFAAEAAGVPATSSTPGNDSRCFEMRTYYAAPGKLDALQSRFRDHTVKLFEKHGIANVGYWVPLENTDNKLIYLLAYPSREARQTMWKEFGADPDWKKARTESEASGKLVTKVESLFLTATDYSPAVRPYAASVPRVFELRTYTASAGNLDALNARFRDHTLKLFARHGMTSIGYWMPDKDQKDSDRTLIYILAHQSQDAAAKCFAEFRADPDWIAAKEASEKKAGGPLTEGGTNGGRSVFMAPTDFSPMK
jgi:hypothetical protein